MNQNYKEIAIIGTTASGKTSLAVSIAKKTNSIILSADSLSIYKEINIASAKPTAKEQNGIKHFGIDEIYCDEEFDVSDFCDIYKKAKRYAIENKKNLIVVGGTGFYIKALVDGLSPHPKISIESKDWVSRQLKDQNKAYKSLYEKDKIYMNKIEKNDKYRIEKALLIYKASGLIPSEYFKQNPKIPLASNLPIFEIVWDKEALRERIQLRTKQMINNRLIDEVIFLEKRYTRSPLCMATIGILETLDYLDGKLTKDELELKISVNTSRLAKAQRTFNNGQFANIVQDSLSNIELKILNTF